MPAPLFWAHARMRGQLEAEEALGQISQTAAGTGSMQDSDQRGYLRQLRQSALGGRRDPTVRASHAVLARIGIKVENVPRADEKEKGGEDLSQSSSDAPN